MRCLTVTPNTAVDTTYVLGRLAAGAINRVERVLPAPGGKGNNVARVLAALGHDVVATGFAGGRAGAFVQDGLADLGISPAFVDVEGETRTCLTLVEADGRTTEVREPGAPVSPRDADRLLAAVADLASEPALSGSERVDAVAVCGSLPPGLDPGYCESLVRVARAAGAYVALDSSGDALRAGLDADPDLVKPNADELAGLLGIPTADLTLEVAARAHAELGLAASTAILLSLGPDGAALLTRDGLARAVPPRVAVANTVGSGDALLAGYLHGRSLGRGDDALRWAVATGTASAMQPAVGVVEYDDVVGVFFDVRTDRPAAVVAA